MSGRYATLLECILVTEYFCFIHVLAKYHRGILLPDERIGLGHVLFRNVIFLSAQSHDLDLSTKGSTDSHSLRNGHDSLKLLVLVGPRTPYHCFQ